MEDDELTQLTLLDAEYAQREAELWEREQRQTRVGRPRKGEERAKGAVAADEGEVGGPGGRMNGATREGPAQRVRAGGAYQEASFDADEYTGRRVARQAVVAALRRARGRISDPERWTPLHLAASRKEHRADLCWWGRWPPPESPRAVKWSVDGAIMAVTPDRHTQRLAAGAVMGVSQVEQAEGHAAALQFLEWRIEAVAGIEAAYVTRGDILAAVARLPTRGRASSSGA